MSLFRKLKPATGYAPQFYKEINIVGWTGWDDYPTAVYFDDFMYFGHITVFAVDSQSLGRMTVKKKHALSPNSPSPATLKSVQDAQTKARMPVSKPGDYLYTWTVHNVRKKGSSSLEAQEVLVDAEGKVIRVAPLQNYGTYHDCAANNFADLKWLAKSILRFPDLKPCCQ